MPRTKKSKKPDTETPQRGRPKGSADKDYANVVVIPPKCPTCGAAIDIRRGKRFSQVVYWSQKPGEALTNVIRRYRTQCTCGQHIAYRRAEFDPAIKRKQG